MKRLKFFGKKKVEVSFLDNKDNFSDLECESAKFQVITISKKLEILPKKWSKKWYKSISFPKDISHFGMFLNSFLICGLENLHCSVPSVHPSYATPKNH